MEHVVAALGAGRWALGAGRWAWDGGQKHLLYDGQDLVAELDAAGTVLRRYVHGPGLDEPLVWYEGAGTAAPRWLVADERGSVVAVTGADGTVLATNRYDAFGRPAAGNQGRFQFTSQAWLAGANLYHYKARAYAPALGRFLQADPLGYADGMNLYAYAANDPVNRVDPSGMASFCFRENTGLTRGIISRDFSLTVVPIYSTTCISIPEPVERGEGGGGGEGGSDGGGDGTKSCKFVANFSAIGPKQALGDANGNGALGFPPPADSVAISPSIFGLSYGEGLTDSKEIIAVRSATQLALKAQVPNIRITAEGLNGPLPGGKTFTIGDVGDRNIRNSPVPRFDIYRFKSQQDALTFGKQQAEATVTGVPSSWTCPGE